MAVSEEENSFTLYKDYIEMSLKASTISKPPRPLTPYNQYCFERQTSERAKGKVNIIQLNSILAGEWKAMKAQKKAQYEQSYSSMKKQYDELYREYKLFNQPEKPSNGYLFFFKEKYPGYQKRRSQIVQDEMTRRIARQWRLLDDGKKNSYRKEAQRWQKEVELKSEYLMEEKTIYQLRVDCLREIIQEQKQKTLKKYGMVKVKKRLKKTRKIQQELDSYDVLTFKNGRLLPSDQNHESSERIVEHQVSLVNLLGSNQFRQEVQKRANNIKGSENSKSKDKGSSGRIFINLLSSESSCEKVKKPHTLEKL